MIKDEKRSVVFSEDEGWLLLIQQLNYSQRASACVHVSFFCTPVESQGDGEHFLILPAPSHLKAWPFSNSCSLCVGVYLFFWPLFVCCSCHLCCSRLSVVWDNGAQIKNAHMHSRFQKPSISTPAESAVTAASEMTAVYICIASRRSEAGSLRPCVCSCHSL